MKFRCIHGYLIEVEVCIQTANISLFFLELEIVAETVY